MADDLLVEAEAALAQAKTLRTLQSNGVKLGRLSAEVEKARAALKSQRRGVAPAPPAADTDAAHMAALSARPRCCAAAATRCARRTSGRRRS